METKQRNFIKQEIEEFLSKLRKVMTKEDLEIIRHNIQQFVVKLAKLNMNLFLLWNIVYNGSKTIYLYALEARFKYKLDLPSNFEDIEMQHKAWYQYITS